jgi:tRNA threonylcarbamoyladenosine biosynthesis protein TsaB
MAEGIALADGDALVVEVNNAVPRTHSERLLTGIRTALDRAGMAPEAIDGFAVAAGPGSFTGLRIGMATARGLALACDRPVVGISTLEAMASWCGRLDRGLVCAWIDAGRGEVYSGLFRCDGGPPRRVGTETVGVAAAVLDGLPAGEAICFAGDGAGRYSACIEARSGRHRDDRILPHHPFLGGEIARLGFRRLQATPDGDRPLRPNYIRKPDAERDRSDAGSGAD